MCSSPSRSPLRQRPRLAPDSVARFFTSAEAAAWGGFLTTHGRLSKRIEENLRRTAGLSHAEYEVLLRLYREKDGRLRIQDLAAQSVLTHSGTSRLIDRLDRAGPVTLFTASEVMEEISRENPPVFLQNPRLYSLI